MAGKILVVHRNELILDVIQEMLQNTGYAVTQTTSGHRALSKAMSEHFQLIIVDRNLTEDLDGIRLVERLRKYGVRAPVIGTAPEDAWEPAEGSAAPEVNRFLSTPFEYSELMEAVDALLNRRPAPSVSLDSEPSLPEPPPAPESLLAPEPPPLAPEPPPPEPSSAPPARSTRTVRPPDLIRAWEPRRLERREGPPRILLVDNRKADRKQVSECLTRAGYEVTAIQGGQEAYEDAMLNDYELILTDLWLVGMDGFELIDALRKSGVTTPIAVLTAYITRDMVREILGWRVRKILVKPARKRDLLSFVRQTVPVVSTAAD